MLNFPAFLDLEPIGRPMKLNEKQKRHLRGLAHQRKPVVIIGDKGLTAAVVREIDLSLAHHELLKVRINAADRAQRQEILAELCQRTDAQLVQSIGHVVIVYRAAERPVIQLPR